ncbi:hypothetical protein IA203_06025 [Corynebacterium wankanglinii]|nr:hypothetical protein IA203_06025 [Corynebacterium wankanglinii]
MRNDNYWGKAPLLDSVEIIDFQEEDAMLNALLSSQVDAIGNLNHSLARVIEADPRLSTLVSETGMWLPLTMRVDVAPFDDVRVRRAMRLVADRTQLVDQVYSGEGQLGNDMFSLYDPAYPKDSRNASKTSKRQSVCWPKPATRTGSTSR